MTTELDRTCWRGMEIGHPADWELSLASSQDSPGRCSFSDRHYQRLDVQWRPLTYVPDMDRMLEKHRTHKGKKTEFRSAGNLPSAWRGLVCKIDGAWVLHAGRYFAERRLLAEVTMLWPGKRDKAVEQSILGAMSAQDTCAATQRWRASGIDATVGSEWDLVTCTSKVGRVSWEFRPRKKMGHPRGSVLTIERIAAPAYWLDEPLAEWLEGLLPERSRTINRGPMQFNSHPGERLTSSTRLAIFSSLRGIRRLRLDIGWQCPTEDRVYHVSYARPSREDDLTLPEHFEVRCCEPVNL